MPNVMMYKTDGTQAGEIKLVDEVFGAEVNANAIHQVSRCSACGLETWHTIGPGDVRKSAAAASSPGARRAPAGPGRVPSALPNGQRAAWYSPPSPVPMP